MSLVKLSKWNTKPYLKVCIAYTHIRLMGALKAQGIDRKEHLPWAAPLQPWAAWVGNWLRHVTSSLMGQSFLSSSLE